MREVQVGRKGNILVIDAGKKELLADYRKNSKLGVDAKKYHKFFDLYTKKLQDLIVDENVPVHFQGIGSISIYGYRPKLTSDSKKGLKVNFAATRKLWADMYPGIEWEEVLEIKNKPVVYHDNQHSDGYVYTIKLRKSKRLKYKERCTFVASKQLKRKTSKAIKNGRKYFEFW